jgi:histidyl-tRNA synthetase
MAAQKPTLPKGTRDFGPADVQKRKYILNTIETVFKKYGFMPLETPTMENLSTLEGKYGEEGDKLLFRILDSGDYLKSLKEHNDKILSDESQDATFAPSVSGKLIDLDSKAATKFISEKGLRYDLTVPFARYVVMHRNEITFPFKRYQMQPVWRADRPQKGRYREFWQCDADVVGSDSLLNELDLIQIYDEAFTKLGIKNYEIKINNRKVLAGIAEVVKSIDVMNNIAVAIDKLDKIGEEGVRKELVEQGFSESELNTLFDIITIKGENKEILNQLKGKLQSSQEGLKGIEELAFILASNPNPNINLTLDFSLARGLSYYTGCIFEVVSNDGTLKSSIGGGGRYDNLTGIFGLPNVSGVGISFGLDRIYDVMEELKLFPEQLRATSTQVIFCHFDEATQLYCLPALKALRDAGIAAEVFADNKKLGKQLDYANALQIPFAAIAGETEMQQQVFTVKNLITGEQQTCTTQALISLVGQ